MDTMKKHANPFMAHMEGDNGVHAVEAQLHVFIYPSVDGGFNAQGLEIDYLAHGETVEGVQQSFADGFLRTVEALLHRGRPLSALFKSKTPQEAWDSFMSSEEQHQLTCGTIVELRDKLPKSLPYRNLAFFQPEPAVL